MSCLTHACPKALCPFLADNGQLFHGRVGPDLDFSVLDVTVTYNCAELHNKLPVDAEKAIVELLHHVIESCRNEIALYK